jgi:hypothetical protein
VQTDRTIPNNKQDITIRDNEHEICLLKDIAISGERNVMKKVIETVLKCKDLTKDIKDMWGIKHYTNN